jgi:hypothetical protein
LCRRSATSCTIASRSVISMPARPKQRGMPTPSSAAYVGTLPISLHPLPLHERPSPLLHRLFGRHRRASDPAPMDFSAWLEAYLGGRRYTFDARHKKPRIGRILMARGRDATDVAIDLVRSGQARRLQGIYRAGRRLISGRQLDADARDVLDDTRADLIRRSRSVANSQSASGLVRGIAARTPCISQKAAVWRSSRTWLAVALLLPDSSDFNELPIQTPLKARSEPKGLFPAVTNSPRSTQGDRTAGSPLLCPLRVRPMVGTIACAERRLLQP